MEKINPREINIIDFDYPLPDDRIARHPLVDRDQCRLLVRRGDGSIEDHRFDELPDLLPSHSMLIYNDTRVINARLRFRKGDDHDGALIEVMLLDPAMPADYAQNFAQTSSCCWHCFVGNSKRWKDAPLTTTVLIDGRNITLSSTRVGRDGRTSIVRFDWDASDVTFAQVLQAAGELPIPPYLNRATEDSDSRDYQTVYANVDGSVAAPTAGLHFTPRVLADIAERDIPRRHVTLHVGAGTFQPVQTDTVGEHPMHSEFISVDRELIEELANTTRRVIAVGTTSVRTLESLYHAGVAMLDGNWDGEVGQWSPYEPHDKWPTVNESLSAIAAYMKEHNQGTFIASTRIIIAPGYDYRLVSGMVTNFHQPQSTLLLLVSAFTGGDWLPMYRHALDAGYRFLSYGDAQLLLKD
ncbi:MAG: S-adenosylmethionine:tRNA ribosyltransferase-isomerase [Muribaculaceae bacterium]|nr:S-adenosylmethionine:tRNA ribosyltransferase-isomerase [Muribaculaceae bacterium]